MVGIWQPPHYSGDPPQENGGYSAPLTTVGTRLKRMGDTVPPSLQWGPPQGHGGDMAAPSLQWGPPSREWGIRCPPHCNGDPSRGGGIRLIPHVHRDPSGGGGIRLTPHGHREPPGGGGIRLPRHCNTPRGRAEAQVTRNESLRVKRTREEPGRARDSEPRH
ncbi:WD repeat-containing protein 6 [Platysternon megacephalum]|uniref:WD repeat-containing protein 6 n=1 Tax=Platysternon megacephalum TaxID=55544 RepID=A0A4D9EUJ3_9SAUR|nr:WD repeat-containing protein 6 [Platysternon megacephalum]